MGDIRVIGRHHRQHFGMPVCEFDILYEGAEYRCDDIQLDRLYKGAPIDEVDVVRLDEVDDDH
jgi:hypothetical protein